MSYPRYVLAKLVSINEDSCGSIEQRMAWQEDADPPEYRGIGPGDLMYVVLRQTTLQGGAKTWELMMYYGGAGSCQGFHIMRRTTIADDPTGIFCIYSGGITHCNLGQATVVDDD